MKAAAVLPAGGVGLRLGGDRRKQYVELAGEAILLRTVRRFLDHPRIRWVVVALPAEDVDNPPVPLPEGVLAVAGGAKRSDSVRLALEAVPEEADVVLIHDAARPLVPRVVIDRVLDAVTPEAGAIAALPVADTLKRVDGVGGIIETVDRQGLWRAQTPQGFERLSILEAHRRAAGEGVAATDDAALIEHYGGRVTVVEGDPRNLKITRPEDLRLAELLLREGEV